MIVQQDKKIESLLELEIQNELIYVKLDLTNNQLSNGLEFNPFVSLNILILDFNHFTSLKQFPQLPFLNHLSLVDNKLNDAEDFLQNLKKFVNLSTLNYQNNPFVEQIENDQYKKRIQRALKKISKIDYYLVAQLNDIEQIKYNDQTQIDGMIDFNYRYIQRDPSKNMKSKSEGNRFIKNNDL